MLVSRLALHYSLLFSFSSASVVRLMSATPPPANVDPPGALPPSTQSAKLKLLNTFVFSPLPVTSHAEPETEVTAPPATAAGAETETPSQETSSEQPSKIQGEDQPSAARPIMVRFCIYGGSLMDWTGGAIVNACNTGGVAGFGIDEMVNNACGPEILPVRKAFGGIPTGEAKVSPSFRHKKVQYVVHATGPVFREMSSLFPQSSKAFPERERSEEEKEQLLGAAYRNALLRAWELKVPSIGYCLLSAGVFRGKKPMGDVIRIGLESLRDTTVHLVNMAAAEGVDSAAFPLKEIAVIAYTPDEQKELVKQFGRVFGLTSDPKAKDASKRGKQTGHM